MTFRTSRELSDSEPPVAVMCLPSYHKTLPPPIRSQLAMSARGDGQRVRRQTRRAAGDHDGPGRAGRTDDRQHLAAERVAAGALVRRRVDRVAVVDADELPGTG